MNIDMLKQIVTGKNPKLKQIHILWLCLNFAEEYPSEGPRVGCIWNTDNSFIINTRIHGEFIERLPNTLNRGLRCHGFKWTKTSRKIRENVPTKFNFNEFPDQLNWDQRSCPGFSKNTTEEEAISWKYHDLIPKNPKKHKIPKNTKISGIYNNKFASNPQQKNAENEFDFTPLDNSAFDDFIGNLSIFKNPNINDKQYPNQQMIYPQNIIVNEPFTICNNYNPQFESICSSPNLINCQNSSEDSNENEKRQISDDEDFFFQMNQFNEDENQEIDFLSAFDNNSDIELELEEHNDAFMMSSSQDIFY